MVTRPTPFPADRGPTARSRRAALGDERTALIARVAALLLEQERAADEISELRARLRELRDILWPAGPNNTWRMVRRPRIGGPSPVSPLPPPGSTDLRASRLRHCALAVLVRAGTELSLPEIHAALHCAGYRIVAPHPVKALADALGYDHILGRARRVRRGVYRADMLSPAQRRRLLQRLPAGR